MLKYGATLESVSKLPRFQVPEPHLPEPLAYNTRLPSPCMTRVQSPQLADEPECQSCAPLASVTCTSPPVVSFSVTPPTAYD